VLSECSNLERSCTSFEVFFLENLTAASYQLPALKLYFILQGIRNVPNKVRIIIQRRRNEDDEDSEGMYSLVTLAEDQNTKNKGVVVLEA